MALEHQIFVYFKTPVAARDEVSRLIRGFASDIGANLASSVACSRREMAGPVQETDTWLEHYRCRGDDNARALLARLAQIDPDHVIVKQTVGGIGGRHIEHFRCV